MSEVSNVIRKITEQARSRSSDKLAMLCVTADAVSSANPEIAKRITSLALEWRSIEGEILPFVKMTFDDLPRS